MPVQLIHPHESSWPKDLDRLAMLDIQGKLKPLQSVREKPAPVTPKMEPQTQPKPTAPERAAFQREFQRQENLLLGKVARAVRLNFERKKKIDGLQDTVKRRDARIQTLENLLAETRRELGRKETQEGRLDATISELRAEISAKDGEIAGLKEKVAGLQGLSDAARRAFDSFKTRWEKKIA